MTVRMCHVETSRKTCRLAPPCPAASTAVTAVQYRYLYCVHTISSRKRNCIPCLIGPGTFLNPPFFNRDGASSTEAKDRLSLPRSCHLCSHRRLGCFCCEQFFSQGQFLFTAHQLNSTTAQTPHVFEWFMVHHGEKLTLRGNGDDESKVTHLVIRIYGALILAQAWMTWSARKCDAQIRRAMIQV